MDKQTIKTEPITKKDVLTGNELSMQQHGLQTTKGAITIERITEILIKLKEQSFIQARDLSTMNTISKVGGVGGTISLPQRLVEWTDIERLFGPLVKR